MISALSYREGKGWSQKRLAHLGVDQSTLARWEKGERAPRGKHTSLVSATLTSHPPAEDDQSGRSRPLDGADLAAALDPRAGVVGSRQIGNHYESPLPLGGAYWSALRSVNEAPGLSHTIEPSSAAFMPRTILRDNASFCISSLRPSPSVLAGAGSQHLLPARPRQRAISADTRKRQPPHFSPFGC